MDDARNLKQEKAADYQVYTVSGSQADIGRQMAAHRQELGAPPLDSLTPEQLDFAHGCAEVLGREYPDALAEVKAMAAAYDRPLDEAYWFLSVGLTEFPTRGLRTSRRRPAAPDPPGCSTVAVLTPSGMVVGRNYDFFYWASTRHLITTRPAGVSPGGAGAGDVATASAGGGSCRIPSPSLAHVGMYDGLLAGRHDGLNEAGLFVSLHGVRSAPPARRRPGLFCVLMVRLALETCRTAREAVARIRDLPHLSSYNYLVADPREAFVVETHPELVRVREAEGGVVAATNHFNHPDMVDLGRRPASGSLARLRLLTEAGRGLAPDKHGTAVGGPAAEVGVAGLSGAPAAVAALMRDHSAPVCGHSDGMATFWSAVAEPGARRVAYCLGAPCRNGYDHVVAW